MTVIAGVWISTGAYDFYRSVEKYIWKIIYPDGVVMDINGRNILHFDHGPKPFGDWQDVKLEAQMTLLKRFAATGKGVLPAEIQLMMRNYEPVSVQLLINGRRVDFSLPPQMPGKSDRKMVVLPGSVNDGNLYIHVLNVSGGDVMVSFDRQRDYGRSYLNMSKLPGEWVVRAGVPRRL